MRGFLWVQTGCLALAGALNIGCASDGTGHGAGDAGSGGAATGGATASGGRAPGSGGHASGGTGGTPADSGGTPGTGGHTPGSSGGQASEQDAGADSSDGAPTTGVDASTDATDGSVDATTDGGTDAGDAATSPYPACNYVPGNSPFSRSLNLFPVGVYDLRVFVLQYDGDGNSGNCFYGEGTAELQIYLVAYDDCVDEECLTDPLADFYAEVTSSNVPVGPKQSDGYYHATSKVLLATTTTSAGLSPTGDGPDEPYMGAVVDRTTGGVIASGGYHPGASLATDNTWYATGSLACPTASANTRPFPNPDLPINALCALPGYPALKPDGSLPCPSHFASHGTCADAPAQFCPDTIEQCETYASGYTVVCCY